MKTETVFITEEKQICEKKQQSAELSFFRRAGS